MGHSSSLSGNTVCDYTNASTEIVVRDTGLHIYGSTLCDSLKQWASSGGGVPQLDGSIPATPGSQGQLSAAYSAVVSKYGQQLSTIFGYIGDDCGVYEFELCVADMETALDIVHTFQGELAKNPPPTCLTAADSELDLGLADTETGLAMSIDALNTSNAAELNNATSYLDQGNSHIQAASGLIKSARC